MQDVTVVVLAGGKGTRLKGLYPDLPKPLIPVGGQPFLYWLTTWISRHGPRNFVYSAGYLGDQIEAWSNDDSLPGLERHCRVEKEPLGTGGGLLNCLELCAEWLLVANGDGLVMAGIHEMLALRHQGFDGGVLGVDVPDTSRYGSLARRADGTLQSFAEKVSGHGLINGGLYLFRRDLLEQFELGRLSLETDIIPTLIGMGARLKVVACDEAPFIDIGTPETVAQAEEFITEHLDLG